MAQPELNFSPSQINVMHVTERVTSIFSLLGIFFILSTFLLGHGFDKPINRLIFFASWSNLGMNIAALIAEDGPRAGQNSSLCQFQAWAIQIFLGVDVFWALCMSFNVYLALFRGWTTEKMQRQEWKYFVGCYGASFIPALAYLFVNTKGRGKVYGPALLWCWVSPKWAFLRVATLYGIVWLAILFAFVIYCMAFAKVWRNRHELRGLFNPFNEDPFVGTVTTEVDVTTHKRRAKSPTPFDPDAELAIPGTEQSEFDPYTVEVEAQQTDPSMSRPEMPEVLRVRSLTRNHALNETNPDARLYARVAFLFFCALLISWVPSSINRLYSLANPTHLNFGLNYTEAFMLPLQGFWNAVVFIITSQTACRNLYRSISGKAQLPLQSEAGMGLGSVESGNREGKRLERFTNRRTSRRLGSNFSSMSSLRGGRAR